ncbi:hypothetical protein PsorP6_009307 [Peronosclerospora sorghi]|uniref:Uncharacterized protein n=1 Tax=Peronosclerospora sorghi TaxID=230839 RepID=A0ACC0W0N3_9STRA|nr:hypothetical protein PsorP6_009307 [Peronosclerospora sorghi]
MPFQEKSNHELHYGMKITQRNPETKAVLSRKKQNPPSPQLLVVVQQTNLLLPTKRKGRLEPLCTSSEVLSKLTIINTPLIPNIPRDGRALY